MDKTKSTYNKYNRTMRTYNKQHVDYIGLVCKCTLTYTRTHTTGIVEFVNHSYQQQKENRTRLEMVRRCFRLLAEK